MRARRKRVPAWLALGVTAIVLLTAGVLSISSRLRSASIGELRLVNGQVIADAVVAYRTAGTLNPSKSNAVLVTTWLGGTSRQLAWQIGAGKLVDSSKYFVITVDALGNGVSSSPSTSAGQPGEQFPVISVADMVESQYQMVTRTLGLSQLHAVVGISMGGMQALQWAVSHPAFMKKIVSIVGSPQAQADDRQRWAEGSAWVRTPVRARVRRALSDWKPRAALAELRLQPYDYIRQVEAMRDFDLTRAFGGSMPRLADAIQSELMVAGAWTDADVNPKPAFELGRLARAEVLELNGRCGHQAPSCERSTLWPAIARFLEK